MTINTPTALTLLRIVLIPILVVLFYSDINNARPLSCLLFFIISITDYFDGFLARVLQQESALGAFLDPVADKLLIIVVLLLLLADNPHLYITLPIIIIVTREVVISALREWMAQIGQANSTAVHFIGKLKTTIQMLALGFMLYQQPLYGVPNYQIGVLLLYLSAIFTLISMFYYIYKSFNVLSSKK
jgi:CDP-diacylglycerol---glycerol-3-phosphate 3-phosphatidyltransferase